MCDVEAIAKGVDQHAPDRSRICIVILIRGTYTATWVESCLFAWSRNELRPGPLALRTVVSSARRMKLLPDTVARPRF